MKIANADDSLIVIGLLTIAFLPHIYLFAIFALTLIVDLIDYIAKYIIKIIKLISVHIFPFAIIFLFCFAIFNIYIAADNPILGHIKDI
jgi:hypothetical protein